jgi:DNA-binding CsgD family transcriptional regulator
MHKDIKTMMQEHRAFLDDCTISEADYAAIEPSKHLLLRLSEVENSTMAVYDTHKQEYFLLRWKFNNEIYCEPKPDERIGPDFFWLLTYPSDLPFIMDTEVRAYEFIKGIPVNERKNYKLILDYRLRNKDGKYIWFTKQSMILEMDRFGEVWLILIFFDLSTGRPANERSCCKIVNMKTGKLFHLSGSTHSSKKLFTPQEVAILDLVAKGFDSSEISQKLFISIHTVNNHRRNILEKSNARTITQALLYAKRVGVI